MSHAGSRWDPGGDFRFVAEVEDLAGWDRPMACTQQASLGDRFIELGVKQLRASATRSQVLLGYAWKQADFP